MLGHTDADVRKTVVFCLVEVCTEKQDANGKGAGQCIAVEDLPGLNPSQVKLV